MLTRLFHLVTAVLVGLSLLCVPAWGESVCDLIASGAHSADPERAEEAPPRDLSPAALEESTHANKREVVDRVIEQVTAAHVADIPSSSLIQTAELADRGVWKYVDDQMQPSLESSYSSLMDELAQEQWPTDTGERVQQWYDNALKDQARQLEERDWSEVRRVKVNQLVEQAITETENDLRSRLLTFLERRKKKHPDLVRYLKRRVAGSDGPFLSQTAALELRRRIEPRVRNADLREDLSFLERETVEVDRSDLAIMRELVWWSARAIAVRHVRKIEKQIKAAADKRLGEADGAKWFALKKIKQSPLKRSREYIEERIRVLARSDVDTPNKLIDRLAKELERSPDVIVDALLQKELPGKIQEALDKEVNFQVSRIRKNNRSATKKHLGKEIAEFYQKAWSKDYFSAKSAKLSNLAERTFRPLTDGMVKKRREKFKGSFSKNEALREVEQVIPKLQQDFEAELVKHLEKRRDKGRCGPTEKAIQEFMKTGLFDEHLFRDLFQIQLDSVVTMVRWSREPKKIREYFAAHIRPHWINRLVHHKLLPLTQGNIIEAMINQDFALFHRVVDALERHAIGLRQKAEAKNRPAEVMEIQGNIDELRRTDVVMLSWNITGWAVVAAEEGRLTVESWPRFQVTPERFLDMDALYSDLFNAPEREERRGEERIHSLKTIQSLYRTSDAAVRPNTILLVLKNSKVLLRFPKMLDTHLRERLELAARSSPLRDFFIRRMESECAIRACRHLADGVYPIPAEDLLKTTEKYVGGVGRGAGGHFQYQGALRDGRNNVSPEQFLALSAIGFFNYDVELKHRLAIPPSITQQMVRPAVRFEDPQWDALDRYMQRVWRHVNDGHQRAMELRDHRRALGYEMVRQRLARSLRVEASDTLAGGRPLDHGKEGLQGAWDRIHPELEAAFDAYLRAELRAPIESSAVTGAASIDVNREDGYVVFVRIPDSVARQIPTGQRRSPPVGHNLVLFLPTTEAWDQFQTLTDPVKEGFRLKSNLIPELTADPKGPIEWFRSRVGLAKTELEAAVLPQPSLTYRLWRGARLRFGRAVVDPERPQASQGENQVENLTEDGVFAIGFDD